MRRVYDENLYQEMIRDHPEVFLGERLSLEARHPTLHGFIPDLIFRDAQSVTLIVEVQLEALDRAHLYRVLEYRDLYKLRNGVPAVRIALFCNSIRSSHKPIVEIHGITVITMSRAEFIGHCQRLYPSMQIVKRRSLRTPRFLTTDRILAALRKPLKSSRACEPDAWMLWTRGWGWGDRRDDFRNLSLAPLAPAIHNRTDFNRWACPPDEWLVNAAVLDGLTRQRLQALTAWCEWLDHQTWPRNRVVVLGYRQYSDPFEYDDYVRNRVKRMYRITWHYLDETWNDDLLQSDLDRLGQLSLCAGQPSSPIAARLYQRAEILNDAGPLWDRADFYRKLWSNRSPHERQQLEADIQQRRSSFRTIKFYGLQPDLIRPLTQLLAHLELGHVVGKGDSVRIAHQCHLCLAKPKRLSETSRQAIRLSDKYFGRSLKTPLSDLEHFPSENVV